MVREAADKGNEANVIKMKSSAIICPCEKQNCRGDKARQEKTARLWYWCATVRDTGEPSGTSSDETDSSDDVIKMSARGCLMKTKWKKKKKDGKPEGQAIRGVAERVRWSRGKQWNSKQVRLWLQESAAEHHEHALRDLFPLGPFLIFTHLPLSVLKPDSIFYTKDTVSNYAR